MVVAALAVSLAIACMQLTKAVHPPGMPARLGANFTGGAIALVSAAGGEHILALGWNLLPSAMLAAVVLMFWTILLVNIRKQYPKHWFNFKLTT